MLKAFWSTHDPITFNQQGNDRGNQYRSDIFYHRDQQIITALQSIQQVASYLWVDPVVTEVTPASTFYPGEKYHQNYYINHPNDGYCREVINPKMKNSVSSSNIYKKERS